MKFKTTRIHFLSDVFAAVAIVVVLKLPIIDKELTAVCSIV